MANAHLSEKNQIFCETQTQERKVFLKLRYDLILSNMALIGNYS